MERNLKKKNGGEEVLYTFIYSFQFLLRPSIKKKELKKIQFVFPILFTSYDFYIYHSVVTSPQIPFFFMQIKFAGVFSSPSPFRFSPLFSYTHSQLRNRKDIRMKSEVASHSIKSVASHDGKMQLQVTYWYMRLCKRTERKKDGGKCIQRGMNGKIQ